VKTPSARRVVAGVAELDGGALHERQCHLFFDDGRRGTGVSLTTSFN